MAQQALTQVSAERLVSMTPQVNNRNVRAAWIKNEESGSPPINQSSGHGLLAWTRIETGAATHPRAAWSYSTNWNAASPTWTSNISDDTSSASPPLRWPGPDNLCAVFAGADECMGVSAGNTWADNGHYDHVADAVWTGLDGVAAIVTTCGKGAFNADDDTDVCIVTSTDGGQHFTSAELLTIPTELGFDTGGSVDPDSVQASLAYFGERTNGNAGDVGLPIYVVWRAAGGFETPKWWFTRVVVGASGQIAESMPPRDLSAIVPDGGELMAGNHASIFGYRHGEHERLGIAYSEPALIDATPACDESDFNTTEEMNWYVTQSDDLGLSWGCFTGTQDATCLVGSSGDRTLLATDVHFRPCVGASRKPGATSVKSRNNDRPEVALNSPALTNDIDDSAFAQFFFFAVNESESGKQRVGVYRTGGSALLGSNTEDRFRRVARSDTPTGWTDAWSQSIDVVQHADSDGTTDTDMPVVLVLWRNNFGTTGMRMRGLGFQNLYNSTSITTSAFAVTNDVNDTNNLVPFKFENDLGLYTGLSHHQGCSADPSDLPGCAAGFVFTYPNEGFFAAWPDTRAKSHTFADIWESGFTF